MEKTFASFGRSLKNDLNEYLNLKAEYAKLYAYEKIARLSGKGVVAIFLVLFFFFAFFFFSFALGYFLGSLFNNVAYGFGIVTLLYLLIGIVLYIGRSKISQQIEESVIKAMLEEEDEKA